MTRVLLVKMSSLGDVVHTLPALTDAMRAVPNVRFDWLVEEAFVPIVQLHPAVEEVLPIALRRWRRTPVQSLPAFKDFRERLRSRQYDLVLDAQGLIKSSVVSRMARGERIGLAADSAREPMAALAYGQRVHVPRERHAVERLRTLFAAALGYAQPHALADYGVRSPALDAAASAGRYLLFLHGTTWANKRWPEMHWRALYARARDAGWRVRLAHASDEEQARAQRITGDAAALLPPSSLSSLLPWIAHAQGVVATDSGLGHLAAAFDVPTVMLYGPTSARRTGAVGSRVRNLESGLPCAPCGSKRCRVLATPAMGQTDWPACLGSMTPGGVWTALAGVLRA